MKQNLLSIRKNRYFQYFTDRGIPVFIFPNLKNISKLFFNCYKNYNFNSFLYVCKYYYRWVLDFLNERKIRLENIIKFIVKRRCNCCHLSKIIFIILIFLINNNYIKADFWDSAGVYKPMPGEVRFSTMMSLISPEVNAEKISFETNINALTDLKVDSFLYRDETSDGVQISNFCLSIDREIYYKNSFFVNFNVGINFPLGKNDYNNEKKRILSMQKDSIFAGFSVFYIKKTWFFYADFCHYMLDETDSFYEGIYFDLTESDTYWNIFGVNPLSSSAFLYAGNFKDDMYLFNIVAKRKVSDKINAGLNLSSYGSYSGGYRFITTGFIADYIMYYNSKINFNISTVLSSSESIFYLVKLSFSFSIY